MNFIKEPSYNSSEEKTKTYKTKVQDVESIADILKKENKENLDKKLINLDKQKLNNQNLYFKDFLTGNLCKIMHNRVISNKQRNFSFLNIKELKNLKKRASFLGKKYRSNFSPKSGKAINNNNDLNSYEKLGYSRTSLENNLLGFEGHHRYSLVTPKFSKEYNPNRIESYSNRDKYNIHDETRNQQDVDSQNQDYFNHKDFNLIIKNNKDKGYIDENYENSFNIENLSLYGNKNLEKKKNDLDKISDKEENTYDSNLISNSKNSKNINLHPRLSMRINQFLADIHIKTKRFSKEDLNYNIHQSIENSSYNLTDTERYKNNIGTNNLDKFSELVNYNKNKNSKYINQPYIETLNSNSYNKNAFKYKTNTTTEKSIKSFEFKNEIYPLKNLSNKPYINADKKDFNYNNIYYNDIYRGLLFGKWANKFFSLINL